MKLGLCDYFVTVGSGVVSGVRVVVRRQPLAPLPGDLRDPVVVLVTSSTPSPAAFAEAATSRAAVLRDVLQPRYLPPGLDRGDASLDTLATQRSCRRSTTTVGALRHERDWSQARDLSAELPDKLPELSALLIEEVRSTTCCPRRPPGRALRLGPRRAPLLIKGPSQLLFGGMGRLSENAVINIKNKSHSVTADLQVPEGGAEGVIVAQGGAFAGLEPVRQGRQAEVLLQPLRAAALLRRGRDGDPARHPPSAHGSSPTTAYGLGKGGDVSLYGRRLRRPWMAASREPSR